MKYILLASTIAAVVMTITPFEQTEAKTYSCTDSSGHKIFTQRKSDCAQMSGTSVANGMSKTKKTRFDTQMEKSKRINEQNQQRRFDALYSNVEYFPNEKTLISPAR